MDTKKWGAEVVADSADSFVGRRVGNHLVEKKLGQGRMGAVYRLNHCELPNTFAALKVMIGDALARPRLRHGFHQEAHAAAAVGSHRVVKPLDKGLFDDGSPQDPLAIWPCASTSGQRSLNPVLSRFPPHGGPMRHVRLAPLLVCLLSPLTARAGVGPSPLLPDLAISTEVNGITVKVRQHAVERQGPGVTFLNKVEIVSPRDRTPMNSDEDTTRLEYLVTARDPQTAHAAGLVLALAQLYGPTGGFVSPTDAIGALQGIDKQLSVEVLADSRLGGLGRTNVVQLTRIFVAMLSTAAGEDTLGAFQGALCGALGSGRGPKADACGAISLPAGPCMTTGGGSMGSESSPPCLACGIVMEEDQCLDCGIVMEEMCPKQ